MSPTLPGPGAVLGRGVTKRCGVCGERRLFERWWTMVERCPRCGLRLAREYGSSLGAMTINTAMLYLTAFVVGGAWVAATWPDVPTLRAGLSTAIAGTLVGTVGYPFARTTWLAITLVMQPPEAPEFARPGDCGSDPG